MEAEMDNNASGPFKENPHFCKNKFTWNQDEEAAKAPCLSSSSGNY